MNWVIMLTETDKWAICGNGESDSILWLMAGAELHEIDLPNASLCSDFLYSKEAGGIVGVSIAVDDNDREKVARFFRGCCPGLVEWVRDGFWLTWRRCVDLIVVEAQSLSVVWCAEKQTDRIVAMVLEDIDYIENEVQAPLIEPICPPSTIRLK